MRVGFLRSRTWGRIPRCVLSIDYNAQLSHRLATKDNERKKCLMTFVAYDSFEDAQAAIERAEQVANERTLPEQAKISGGDYWMRFHQGEFIFGYVFTFSEAHISEMAAGATAAEARDSDNVLRERHVRGYRFGKCYSTMCVDGELGDTHVSVMMPITMSEFHLARDAGWSMRSLLYANPDAPNEKAMNMVIRWDALMERAMRKAVTG